MSRRRSLVLMLLFAAAAAPTVWAAEPLRIAVSDFQVQSDNPNYKYFGKGFAEFTAIELGRSKDMLIIDREKRNRALEEAEFSLSDMADPAKQLRVGQLLAARYLIGGDIFELGGRLVVVITVLDVQTGASAFSDKVSGEPGAYDFIAASLAGRILSHFGIEAPRAAMAKASGAAVKPELAAV